MSGLLYRNIASFVVYAHTYGHENAANTYVGAQSLSYPGTFPENAHNTFRGQQSRFLAVGKSS